MSQQYLHRSGQWKRSPFAPLSTLLRNIRNGSLLKNILTLGFLAGVLGLFVLAILFAVYSRNLPDPNQLSTRRVSQSTKIFDRTGEHLLYEIHGEEKRTLRTLQEGFCGDDPSLKRDEEKGIPLFAVKATIAAEDHKFCTHGGFSFTGLLRAIVFGGSRGGGSTLTQQLVKNAILTNEKTLTRKIKELILSVELERRYSKDEILQIYFNEIPYGSTNYGIESAAYSYFGKSSSELTIAEAATLAALPKAPTTYINNPERLKARRDYILGQMNDLGFISETEKNEATAIDTPLAQRLGNITAPHFVFYVKEQLENAYGQRMVEEGGLRVTTTIDYDKQIAAEEAVKSGVEANGEKLGFTNAALVAIDPKTGQILAMVGSKDYFDEAIDGSVNVATRPRQPGSSFKPIVYAAAFERGLTPNTILWDVNTTFPTDVGDYTPKNYDEKERGPVTIRQALQGSLNIPAVKTIYLTGLEYVFKLAQKFGYSTYTDLSQYGLSFALGSGEVKLLEHTDAYAALANDGVRYESVSVLKVEDANGATLSEWKQGNGEKIVEPEIARLVTNVLSDNAARAYVFGPNSFLQLGAHPVAAKTGTTNDSKDAWTMGYTPSLAAGVWAGNNRGQAMTKGGGVSAAGPIWNAFMKKALEGSVIETFQSVEIPLTGKAMLDGHLPAQTATIDRVSGKLATPFTPESDREIKTCAEFHSILHSVNPSDIRGPAPERPEDDPQYTNWETAIADWIRRFNAEYPDRLVGSCTIPTEEDDAHTAEGRPNVTFSGVALDAGRFLTPSITVASARPIMRVEYRLDRIYIGASMSFPFSLRMEAPLQITSGTHTLTATAFDDVGNNGIGEAGVVLGEPNRTAIIEILDPTGNQEIEKTVETFSVSLQLRNPSKSKAVTLFAAPRETGMRQLVGSVVKPSSNFFKINWKLPPSGDWILTAVSENSAGGIETSQSILVHIKSVSSTGTSIDSGFNPFGLL